MRIQQTPVTAISPILRQKSMFIATSAPEERFNPVIYYSTNLHVDLEHFQKENDELLVL
ncbi:MAG: hypothetical protein QNJ31_03530 [Candidatus Caenarcaniphilales bacterium]|nr:hypothetical protein [Candidatus Caenarcaniphilales bacterium]